MMTHLVGPLAALSESYELIEQPRDTLLRVVDKPSSGNSLHHHGSSKDGKTLWGGGLLPLLKT